MHNKCCPTTQHSTAQNKMAAGESPAAKKVKFSEAVEVQEYHAHPAADALTFHLLEGGSATELATEIDEGGGWPFQAEFFNQVFGDAEEIKGYQGLSVDIWLSLRSFHAWIDVSYEDMRPGADDIIALLREWWPEDCPFFTDRAEFLAAAGAAPEQDFATVGPALAQLPGELAGGRVTLHHTRLTDAPAWFKELHARMSPLIIFTIDGASHIDRDDPKWEVVAAAVTRPDGRQCLVGLLLLYNFYAWPLGSRPRVAQVLVLPPMQGGGAGKALLRAAYGLAAERGAVDLTFEDPAPGLQRLREKLELEMLMAQPWAADAAAAALTAAAAAEESRHVSDVCGLVVQQPPHTQPSAPAAALLRLAPTLQRRITQELKIHRHQVPAVWEALLTLLTPAHGSNSSSNGNNNDRSSSSSVGAGATGGRAGEHKGADKDDDHDDDEEEEEEEDDAKGSPNGDPSMDAALAVEAAALWRPLQQLVMERLEATATGSAAAGDRGAGRKRLVKVEGKPSDWFVYKVPVEQEQQHQQRMRAGGGGLQGPPGDIVSVGRHTITQVSAEDMSERLQQVTAERLGQLCVLRKLMQHQTAVAAAAAVLPAHDTQPHHHDDKTAATA